MDHFTRMNFQVFTVLVSLLVFGVPCAKGACPGGPKAVLELNECLSTFNSLTDFSKGPITATQLNNYCGSAAQNSEIQCAENIVDDCRRTSPTTRRILDKAVSVNAIRGSVKILCNNTQIFADKQDCIGQYQSSVTSCMAAENLRYNSKLTSIQAEAYSKGAEWLEKKIYEEICYYVGEVADCQRPYGQNCGREIGDVFDALTHAATPPVCVGVMTHVNLIVLIFLAFIAVMKGNL